MHCFRLAGFLFTLGVVFAGVGWAQSVETFSAGSNSTSAGPGGQYDASVCNDPRIPVLAAQQKATPYHDPNWNTPGDPLKEALDILAQKYNNNKINGAGACAHAPGVVFMVPTNLVPEVTKLIGQIISIQSGGQSGGGGNNNTTDGTSSSGQPGGGPNATNRNGQPITGGTSGGGQPNQFGRPGTGGGYSPPTPGPNAAANFGQPVAPNADPCRPRGPNGYDFCNNGPGARLPAGCYCNTPPPPQPAASKPTRLTPDVKNSAPDTIRYTAGVVNGLGNCVQSMVDLVAAAGYLARGYVDVELGRASGGILNTEPANSAPFAQAAKLLGLQPGQSIILRQIAQEAEMPRIEVNGKPADPYIGGTSAGQRICLYGLIPGAVKAAKGVPPETTPIQEPGTVGTRPTPEPGSPGTVQRSPGTQEAGSPGTRPTNTATRGTPPINGSEGTTPTSAVRGTRLSGVVSDNVAAPSLTGRWIQTPRGPIQLGNFVGKGEFGAVYEKAGNPNQVVKIGTNLPDTQASFNDQVAGKNLLKAIDKNITPNIDENIPASGGQPPVMTLDNVFKKPGAFQATSKGTARTQATIDAGTPTDSLPKVTPAEARQVQTAKQQLIDKITGGGLIAGDLHGGNIAYVPDGAGGLTAMVVDSDIVGTKAGLVKELGGREGADILREMAQAQANGVEPPVSRLMQSIVNVLEAGNADLSVLNPNMDSITVMNALEQARQNIAAQAAANRAGGGGLFAPGL